jgi:hypothetical protein
MNAQNTDFGIFIAKNTKSKFENTLNTISRIFMAIEINELLWPLKFVASPLHFSKKFFGIIFSRNTRKINSLVKGGITW